MFRAAWANDFEDVMRLYRQLHPDDPVMHDGSDAAAFAQILKAPALTLFVLEVNDSVVATTYLNVIPNITRSASPYAIIENVVVEESLRGTGLGKAIMSATLDVAWEVGCYKAMLMTGSPKPATHAFYKACGFSADVKTAYVARPSEAKCCERRRSTSESHSPACIQCAGIAVGDPQLRFERALYAAT